MVSPIMQYKVIFFVPVFLQASPILRCLQTYIAMLSKLFSIQATTRSAPQDSHGQTRQTTKISRRLDQGAGLRVENTHNLPGAIETPDRLDMHGINLLLANVRDE